MCLSVCLSARISREENHTRDLYQISVHVAYVVGSVLLRHVDDRPHRLSAGRDDGTAQRGRSMLSTIALLPLCHLHGYTSFDPTVKIQQCKILNARA